MNRAFILIMQIGIDLGATKIEYVLLDNKNKELI